MQPSRWQQWAPWSIQSLAEEIKRLSVYWLSFSSSLEDREYLELCSRRNTATYNIISIDRIPSLRHFWKRGVSSSLTWVEWKCTQDPEGQRHSCEGCWLLGDPFRLPSLTVSHFLQLSFPSEFSFSRLLVSEALNLPNSKKGFHSWGLEPLLLREISTIFP